MKALPGIISRTTLKSIDTDDTHAVRIIAYDVSNHSPYKLRCRHRTYIFERDGNVGRHILDVPVSLWQQGSNARGRHNDSMPEDFRNQPNASYGFHVVEIARRAPATVAAAKDFDDDAGRASDAGHLRAIRRLLSGLGAPDVVADAFALIEGGATVDEIDAFVSSALSARPNDAQDDRPAADSDAAAKLAAKQERARKMREAKQAKRESRNA